MLCPRQPYFLVITPEGLAEVRGGRARVAVAFSDIAAVKLVERDTELGIATRDGKTSEITRVEYGRAKDIFAVVQAALQAMARVR